MADIVNALATHLVNHQRKASMEGSQKEGKSHRLVMFRAKQKAISAKIRTLRHEGKSQKEAVGAAYGMARAGRLGPKGGYRRASR